ncbi:MAG TPA: type I 3-dehydroquinate dehydratase, partial [Chthoniobacterales bacterium]
MRQRKSQIQLNRPNIVGIVETPTALRRARSFVSGALDIIEVRLDAMESAPDLRGLAHPILATARAPKEGGRNDLNVRERASRYLAVLDCVAAVDVE